MTEIDTIIEEEEAACSARVDARIRPVLLREFRLVAKTHKITRVGFINGACLIQREGEETIDTVYSCKEDVPDDLWQFASMCDKVADQYPTSDITPADLEETSGP